MTDLLLLLAAFGACSTHFCDARASDGAAAPREAACDRFDDATLGMREHGMLWPLLRVSRCRTSAADCALFSFVAGTGGAGDTDGDGATDVTDL